MAYVFSDTEATLSRTGWSGAGLIRKLDPRLRILAALIYAIAVVALSSIPALIAALICSLLLFSMAQLPLRRTLKRVAMMDSFIFFMLALLPFTVPGTPIFSVFGFTASFEGMIQAITIGLTANAVVLAMLSLVGTMEPVTLGHALHALKCPDRLVHLMMFTVRYIDVLREEHQRLRTSMKTRGFKPGTNWHTYRSYGYLVGMMLVRAVERSERILGAMKCRGFTGRILLLEQFKLKGIDWVFAAGLGIGILALFYVEYGLAST